MTIFLLVSALAFAFLSVLPFQVFQIRAFWLASVILTEYGQYLILLALVGVNLSLARRGWAGWLAAACFALSLIVFIRPTVQMYVHFGGWQRQMRRAFGGPLAESRFVSPDPLRLFLGFALASRIAPREITYASHDGRPIRFDFYPPPSRGPAPWVLVIHGGGWNSGDRRQMSELNSYLALRGVGVVSVDYRLAPAAPWPAARDDVLAAAHFVRAHAKDFNLDPDRWVIFGRSAGGQLAQIVAYAAHEPGLRGCVSLYAPTDMFKAYDWGAEHDILGSRPLVREYMGGPPEALVEAYRDASPLEFVSKATPPTLQLHGARDPLVWIHHAERLRDRLTQAGVANALIEIPWGTHGFDYNLWGPGGQTLTVTLEYFLHRVF